MNYDSNPFDEGSDSNAYRPGLPAKPQAPASNPLSSFGGAFFGGGAKKPTPLPPERMSSGISDATDEIPLGNAQADFKKKERELRAKEEELRRKELELKRREEEAARAGIVLDVRNWPPFWPIIHHDIEKDIPEHLRPMVTRAFYSWLGIMVCLVWNLIAVIAAWVGKGVRGSAGLEVFLMAIIYVLAGLPLSYWLWYKRLYNACRKDRALTFAWFFLMYSVHTAFCIYATVAPPFIFKGKSLTGVFPVLQLFSDGRTIPAIFYTIGLVFWGLEAFLSCIVFMSVYHYFRGTGKANELRREAAQNAVRAAM